MLAGPAATRGPRDIMRLARHVTNAAGGGRSAAAGPAPQFRDSLRSQTVTITVSVPLFTLGYVVWRGQLSRSAALRFQTACNEYVFGKDMLDRFVFSVRFRISGECSRWPML